MNTAKICSLHSSEFQELHQCFRSLAPPYGLGDIARFNRIYQPIYFRLSREERRRAEEFVDELIDGLTDRRLAAKIFGVV